jgi:UDPglucose 6-dehydrogenase
VVTTLETAELIKYASNCFLATKISFINEIANVCEVLGADVQMVAKGIGMDRRIGSKFLHAGPGYGGSCFPKDTLALVKTAQDAGAPLRIIETVVDVNDRRKAAIASRIIEACGGSVTGKTIAVLGLTFKPNTDDMRDAPSLDIIPALQAAGARLKAYDPESMHEAGKMLTEVDFCDGPYHAIDGADAMVLITEWDQFRALDLDRVKKLMKSPVVVDLRNVYQPADMIRRGFAYVSVGRPQTA